MDALIFNIQKFSLHDGPGIRTVVFLKGCPLRCKWCANPESQTACVQILWDRETCAGCGACVGKCPAKVIRMEDECVHIDPNRCTGCGMCVGGCKAHALTREGERRSLKDVLKICLQDEMFYEESGGGVTLSGGEPMMQAEFAMELLKALRALRIHTAIETTGFADPALFDLVSDCTDLLLFDMKHWDEKRHEQGTGVENQVILRNMRRAIEKGIDVLPRIPVIPGYNDGISDAEGFCLKLHEAGASRVQLLPFHQFGEMKYEMLGLKYTYKDINALHEEELEAYRAVFAEKGIEAFF